MKNTRPSREGYVKGRWKALRYVARGLGWVLKNEPSIHVQAGLMLLSFALAFWWKFSIVEWMWLIMLWGLIFVAETLNTAIEKLADVVNPEYDERIRDVKDISAGAVGWAAIAAAVAYFLLILNHFNS